MAKNSFKNPPFTLDRSRYGDLADQIASGLRTAITTGYYAPGDVLPPVRDLARLLDVSKGIAEQGVSIVREEGLISPRPHVGSVVCAKDRPLWKGHVVIVVPPGVGNPFDNSVHAVLRDSLTGAGYLVTAATVLRSASGTYSDFALLDTVLRQQVDLVVQLHDHAIIARWLSRRGIPFARLTTDASPPSTNCIGTVLRSHAPALRDLTEHCREAGVKRAILISAWHSQNIAEAIAAAGAKVATWRFPRQNGSTPTGLDLSSWAADTFSSRLSEKGRAWPAELLFFDDDHLATGGLLALAAAGVRIPDDVRVASWANREYGPVWLKPITRMEMDCAAVGSTLADCVLNYLRDGTFPQGVVGPQYVKGETF